MAAVVLALVALAYLAPLLAGRQMGHGYLLYDYPPWQASKPPGFEVGGRNANLDVATQNLPFTEIARDQLKRGEAPLWNPYNYGGTPLLGDMQSALLYPLTWLGLLIGFEGAIGWMCVLKLFTAGFGTYLLARELRLRAGPSLVGALVYMLGAPIVAWLQTPLGTVLTLLPFLVLTTERLRREPSVSRAAGLAAVVALSIFAGHPETAALSSAAAAVYLVAAMWGRRAGEYLRAFGGFIGAHALGVCAAAIVIIPFLSALQGSITAEVHGDHGAVHLPAGSGLVLFMPNVYGEGPEYRGPLFFYLSVTGYFGVAAMLFAVCGVWARRAEPYVRGLLAAAVVALMVIFSIPPVSWIVPHVPPYSGSLNVRVFHVVALAGAILAAAGLDAVLRQRIPRRRIVYAAGGLLAVAGVWFTVQWLRDALPAPEGARALAVGKVVLFVGLGAAVLALAARVRTRLVLAAAAVVVVLDLAYMHDYNPLLPAEQANPPEPPVARFLASRPAPFRISPSKPSERSPNVFLPNTTGLYDLAGPQGYDYPQSARWSRFSSRVLGEEGKPRGPARTGLQLMNVRYYVAPPAAPPPGPRLQRVYAGRDATVYEDPAALPRAFLVPGTRRVRDPLALMERGRLDPRREALIAPDAPRAPAGDGFRPLRARQLDATHWRIAVPPGAAGWMVLGNSFSGDWKATVDGRDAELTPTNYTAMGVAVPRGARSVDVELDRARIHAAAVLSVLAWLAIAVLIAVPAVRRAAGRRRQAR
jgi:hypothetical protein